MSPLESARIRLEGQLEIVEAMTNQLTVGEATPAHALAVAFEAQRSRPLSNAEEAVRAMSTEVPQLAPTLRSLARARKRFEKVVMKRAALLRLPKGPIADTVVNLAQEPIRYSHGSWHLAVWTHLAPMLVIYALSVLKNWRLLAVAPLVCGGALVVRFLAHERIVITSKRLIARDLVCALETIESVTVSRSRWWDRDRRARVTVRQRGGREGSFRTRVDPLALAEALRSEHVAVEGPGASS